MGYPEGLSGSAICAIEGCEFHGSGACVRCGSRLRCYCGQFITDRGFDAHMSKCRVAAAAERNVLDVDDGGHVADR